MVYVKVKKDNKWFSLTSEKQQIEFKTIERNE